MLSYDCGVESIIVDGGGRIEFIGDEYANPLIQTAFIGSFLISDEDLTTITRLRK